jgi:enolase
VVLDSGARGRAAVPSGASTGEHEAVELRDGGDRYAARESRPRSDSSTPRSPTHSRGSTPTDQRGIDRELLDLDGTDNKGRIGANAILGTSDRRGEGRCRPTSTSRSTAMSEAPMHTSCRFR